MNKKIENLGITLTREQSKKVVGGDDTDNLVFDPNSDNGYKCCWDSTPSSCSVCAAYGSCVTGAHIVKC